MTYDEVQVGQHVRINTRSPKYREDGHVVAKRELEIAGHIAYRVWVDTYGGKRRIVVPDVLMPIDEP